MQVVLLIQIALLIFSSVRAGNLRDNHNRKSTDGQNHRITQDGQDEHSLFHPPETFDGPFYNHMDMHNDFKDSLIGHDEFSSFFGRKEENLNMGGGSSFFDHTMDYNIVNTLVEALTPNVVGGIDADPHSFYTILLHSSGLGYRWAGCGGTLISTCHILTAGHCVSQENGAVPIDYVYVNAHRPFDGNLGLPFHFTSVDNITVHENFNRTSMAADVAIIKMSQCLDDTSEITPAQLAHPDENIPEGLILKILGFGKLSEQASLFSNVEVLQEAQLPFITTDRCREYYGDRVHNDMFCAGFEDGGIDACQGDSGGGLVHDSSRGNFVQIGIVSWGHGCGRQRSPGVYSSVQYHYAWIKERVCNDQNVDQSISLCSSTSTVPASLTIPPSPGSVFRQTTAAPTMEPTMPPTSQPTSQPTSALCGHVPDYLKKIVCNLWK